MLRLFCVLPRTRTEGAMFWRLIHIGIWRRKINEWCSESTPGLPAPNWEAGLNTPLSFIRDSCSGAVFCITVRKLFRNFPDNFRFRLPKVRSPGQVKWPHLRKKITTASRPQWFQDLVYYQVPTTCISRIFYIGDLRSGQFRDLPIISRRGKTKTPQIRIRFVQIVENHAQSGYCWWPRCNFAYVTSGKVIWGQKMTSGGQCTFLLITFDRNEIETELSREKKPQGGVQTPLTQLGAG